MCPAACALCLLWHKVHAQARPFCPILSFLSPCPERLPKRLTPTAGPMSGRAAWTERLPEYLAKRLIERPTKHLGRTSGLK